MRAEMKSPVTDASVNRKLLKKVTLEEGLIAFRCDVSQGIYIPLQNYWNWLIKRPERLEHLPKVDAVEGCESELVTDNGEANFYSGTNTIMGKVNT